MRRKKLGPMNLEYSSPLHSSIIDVYNSLSLFLSLSLSLSLSLKLFSVRPRGYRKYSNALAFHAREQHFARQLRMFSAKLYRVFILKLFMRDFPKKNFQYNSFQSVPS